MKNLICAPGGPDPVHAPSVMLRPPAEARSLPTGTDLEVDGGNCYANLLIKLGAPHSSVTLESVQYMRGLDVVFQALFVKSDGTVLEQTQGDLAGAPASAIVRLFETQDKEPGEFNIVQRDLCALVIYETGKRILYSRAAVRLHAKDTVLGVVRLGEPGDWLFDQEEEEANQNAVLDQELGWWLGGPSDKTHREDGLSEEDLENRIAWLPAL